MNMYMDKLSLMVPVVKNRTVLMPGYGAKAVFAEMEFIPEGEYYENIPYLQGVEDIWQQVKGGVRKRIFLVTEEDNIAVKTAVSYLIYPIYESREELLEQMADQGYTEDSRIALLNEDGKTINLRVISLAGEKKANNNENPFLSLAVDIMKQGVVFFNGLENNAGLEDKLDVIMTSPDYLQFVQISKEQLGMPWVRELMMDRECEVLVLPRVPNSYYEKITRELLEGERYKLEEGLTVEQLVRSIRKKCTNKFREEDMAWSLDLAAKRAKSEGRYSLRYSDFSIEQIENESPMERLKKLTGLENVKQLTREYAALGREQEKNEKILEFCKHLIFAGSPGSGKTMCGELLAGVMAEEGQSNGSFVVASRKDVIGEYVGHTAPKIAKLFQRARHGVLFVDEAGFMLQETRRGFTEEAVKEFVRYMELYQDVTVIFALYPHEVEEWLSLDAGLSSRIGRIIKFDNYSDKELVQIGKSMCGTRGYQMEEQAERKILEYIKKRRQMLNEKFGNAREMRKLVEAAIIAKSVRCFDGKEEELWLRTEDFEQAIGRLLQENQERKRVIGFVTGGMSGGRREEFYEETSSRA